MYDDVIKLISEQVTLDEYGDMQTVPMEREIFADKRSIGQSEFYQAAANGLQPEIKFIIADNLDYQGEKRLRYQPFGGREEEYTVIRTFQPKDSETLEIVCRKGIE